MARCFRSGFRPDVEAVVVEGVAHRSDWQHVVSVKPDQVSAGGVHRGERCPGVSALPPAVRDPLTQQLERSLEALVH